MRGGGRAGGGFRRLDFVEFFGGSACSFLRFRNLPFFERRFVLELRDASAWNKSLHTLRQEAQAARAQAASHPKVTQPTRRVA